MSGVQQQLHAFATTLLERRGAVVDWPTADGPGTALLPPEVAAAGGHLDEVVELSCDTGGSGLAVNLAGDFLEWSGRLLDAEPRVGTFRVREMYLRRKEIDEGIARAFSWPNAKVKIRDASEATAEYPTWWFHGTATSEDRWETCFSLSLNALSGLELPLPNPLDLWELESNADPRPEVPTFARAAELAQRRLLHAAAPFFQRMDSRLQRDRKRLRDYYNALLREADKKKPRAQAAPDPEKAELAKRAVQLELRRKLAELDERYAITVQLRPILVVRTELPVLAVDLSVCRKQAQRLHTVYWNPLLRQFEPMACSQCGEGTFAPTFTNDIVAPLCAACSQKSK